MKIKLILLLSICTALSFGQGRLHEKKDQIKALKIAFITDKLELSSDEATKFWPIFNSFEEKQQDIRKQKMKNIMTNLDDDSLDKISEKEANTLLSQMESADDEQYQNRKKFISSLKGVLPTVKILKLKKAEEEFSRKLLKQYKDNIIKK